MPFSEDTAAAILDARASAKVLVANRQQSCTMHHPWSFEDLMSVSCCKLYSTAMIGLIGSAARSDLLHSPISDSLKARAC